MLFTLITAQYIPYWICAVLGVLLLLGAVTVNFFRGCDKRRFISVALLTVSCALSLFAMRYRLYAEPVTALDGVCTQVKATVIDEPSYDSGKFTYTMRAENVAGEGLGNFKFEIVSYKELGLREFDVAEGTLTFYRAGMTGLYGDGIFIRAYVNSPDRLTVSQGKRTLYYYAIAARKAVRNAVSDLFDADEGGLITSVLIGDRSGLSDTALSAVRRSGISHITVISGLHMSILISLILAALHRLLRSYRIASAAALPFAFGIMAISGFSPSVTRAGITCIIFLAGNVLYKRANGLNSLSIAVLLQCLFNPFVICSVSFLLSVFATLGILLLEQKIKRRLTRLLTCRVAVVRHAVSAVSLTLSAQIMTLPVVIITFGYITPLAAVTNVLIEIPTTLLVCLSAAGAALLVSGIFGYIGKFLLLLAGLDAKLILFIAKIMSKPSFSGVYITSFSALITCAAICCVLFMCAGVSVRRRVRFAALLVTLTAAVGTFCYAAFESGNVTVTAYGTYSGSAVLFSDGKSSLLIGGGKKISAANGIAYDLQSDGTDSVDMLILPPDCDYYSGGATTLLRKIGANEIVYSDQRLDLMKLDGTKRYEYADCTVTLSDKLSAEVRKDCILVFADGVRIAIPTERCDELPDADIVIAPDEFISNTCNAKCAIILRGETDFSPSADKITESTREVYILPNGQNAEISARDTQFSVRLKSYW